MPYPGRIATADCQIPEIPPEKEPDASPEGSATGESERCA